MNKENYNDTLDLRRYLRMIRRGRWFYAICIALAVALSVTYALVSNPVYRNNTEIMIETEGGGSAGNILSMMGGGGLSMENLFAMGGLGSSTMDDEMLLLGSNHNYLNVSRLMQMNRTYIERHGLRKQMLYKTSPIRVEAPAEYFDTLSTKLKLVVKLEADGRFSAKLKKGFMSMETVATVSHEQMPYMLQSPWGDLLIMTTDSYAANADTGREIQVHITSNQKVAYAMLKEIGIEPVDKRANAVRLTMKHPEKQYAYDVLSALTTSYSDIRNEHKHHTSSQQVEFFDQRIATLLTELDTVQSNVKLFMTSKGVIDIAGQTEVLLQSTEMVRAEMLQAEAQLNAAKEVLNLLESAPDDYPSIAVGMDEEMVKAYNELVLKRVDLLSSAKEGNAALTAIEDKLKLMRKLVIEGMKQLVLQSRTTLATLKGYHNEQTNKLGEVPGNGLEFLNLQRSFELKNSLLLFLLQQRENALLDMTNQKDAGFVYEPPYTEKDKDYSKKIIVALLLLFLSIAGPTFLLWCYMLKCDRLEDDSDLPVALRQHGCHSARDMRRLLMSQKGVETLYLQPLEGAEDMRAELTAMMHDVPGCCELKSVPQLDVLLANSDVQLDDAHLLVILVHGCQMKRKTLQQMLEGVNPDHVFVCVGAKK